MRIRMFIEVELDDAAILQSLEKQGEPEYWGRELAAGLARQTEAHIRTLYSVKEVKAVYIPKMLSSL